MARHKLSLHLSRQEIVQSVSGLAERPWEQRTTEIEELGQAAQKLGCHLSSPFSVLSFLALPVIPELKLTGMGLLDVKLGELLTSFVGRSVIAGASCPA